MPSVIQRPSAGRVVRCTFINREEHMPTVLRISSQRSRRAGHHSDSRRHLRNAVVDLGASTRRFMSTVMVGLLALAVVAGSATPARADMTAWTAQEAAEANAWNSVAYGKDGNGDGLWVAVASDGTNRVMTSPDGETWSPHAAAEANAWNSVAYGKDGNGDGLWVAVASGGTNRVMTSPDGETWSAHAAAELNAWRSVAYGDALWVAVAESGTNRVMTSPDGENWSAHAAAEDNLWFSVAYGGGLWVAVGEASFGLNPVMTSPNGITWTARGDGLARKNSGFPFDDYWESVAYGDGLWVAVAYFGPNQVISSRNGISWTPRAAAEANYWTSVAYGGGLWVAVASDGTNRVMTSRTLVSTAQVTPPSVSVSCVPLPLAVGASVTCTVSGGDPEIDILWRAAYNPVFAEAGVALDATGSGAFSFVVPAAALGQEVTVELVEWLTPVSLGVVGGPVPGSIPAGGGPVPVWSLVLVALVGVVLMRRGMLVKG